MAPHDDETYLARETALLEASGSTIRESYTPPPSTLHQQPEPRQPRHH